MYKLPDSQKRFVKHDLLYYLAELRALRSTRLGKAVGVIPPYRVMRATGEVDGIYVRVRVASMCFVTMIWDSRISLLIRKR